MVNTVGVAVVSSHDTTDVELSLVGIDADDDWASVIEVISHLILNFLVTLEEGGVNVAGLADVGIWGEVFAGLVNTGIRIVVLIGLAVLLDVVLSEEHVATIAARVGLVAVNKLLLRELHEAVASDGVGGFDGSSSGESPA